MRAKEIHDEEMEIKYKYSCDLLLKSGQDVGFIRLVIYKTGPMALDYPQLEYEIEEKYRNQGIMSQELPKYLKYVFENREEVIVALCKEDNFVSKKLLEKNGFFNTGKIEDKIIFLLFKKFYKN
jgi:RimJ/RimL family protein N-acetyltransferase